MSDPMHTALHEYTVRDEFFYSTYETYQAEVETIARVQAIQPVAHVITISRYTCPDCARNVPRMTRIAEHLPGWTWEIFDSSDVERRAQLNITRIPTFIVYDRAGGRELGRIVENPSADSLEKDLLGIVQSAGTEARSIYI